jgi:REP element-mobilizing transposase RayT/DNA-binding NarL/FixJ family response regulator
MTIPVLVATPHPAFGELLRSSLEDEGRFRVHLVRSAANAAEAALPDSSIRIAILDGDLSGMPLSALSGKLLSAIPGLKLVIIPPDNDPNHASLAGVAYHGYLLRPFYLPDLMELMNRLSEPLAAPKEIPATASPAMFTGENFERALAETSAQAGLALDGSGRFLTGGALTEEVSAELKGLAQRALGSSERTDLVRFVRLPGQTSDHLFYITSFDHGAGSAVLGLAYALGTPLSRVRVQAGQVARALAPATPAVLAAQGAQGAHPALASPPTWLSIPANAQAPEEGFWAEELAEDEGEIQEINLAALLGSVPPPDPDPREANDLPARLERGAPGGAGVFPGTTAEEEAAAGWVPEISMSLPRAEGDVLFPWDELEETRPEAADVSALGETIPINLSEPSVTQPVLEETHPVHIAETEEPQASSGVFLQLDEPPVNELEDTKPRVLTNLTKLDQLEPVSPAFSELSYTCVLIPRLPQHYLTSLLSEKVGQWVPQLCVAFGWRLKGIAVRPEYLQWTVQLLPSIAPSSLMRILRQRISASIFEEFPALARENPSGDFWATGYLIVSGPQPPSPRLLREYIAETRRRQGVAFSDAVRMSAD